MLEKKPPKKTEIAKACEVSDWTVYAWFSGTTQSLTGKNLLIVSELLGVNPVWLETGRGAMRPNDNAAPARYYVTTPDPAFAFHEIEFVDASGSCGGGSIAWEMEKREPIVKEQAWFNRYKVKPADCVMVWADGDSMADFIVDGDIVFFNTRKTEPRSGRIFLIDHPDGLRIKRLRRDIEGAWILESSNPDKRRYPDERIAPDQADLLRIRGEFFYRQGG